MSTPDTKPGFLSAGIGALSPWGSRATTPKPPQSPKAGPKAAEEKAAGAGIGTQRGGDHMVSRTHRISPRKYPVDCPSLTVRWFHAVDASARNMPIISLTDGELGRFRRGDHLQRMHPHLTSPLRARRNGSLFPQETLAPSRQHSSVKPMRRKPPRRGRASSLQNLLLDKTMTPRKRPVQKCPSMRITCSMSRSRRGS